MEDDMELEYDDAVEIPIVREIIKKELFKIKSAVRIKDYFENVIASYPESSFKLHFRIATQVWRCLFRLTIDAFFSLVILTRLCGGFPFFSVFLIFGE